MVDAVDTLREYCVERQGQERRRTGDGKGRSENRRNNSVKQRGSWVGRVRKSYSYRGSETRLRRALLDQYALDPRFFGNSR